MKLTTTLRPSSYQNLSLVQEDEEQEEEPVCCSASPATQKEDIAGSLFPLCVSIDITRRRKTKTTMDPPERQSSFDKYPVPFLEVENFSDEYNPFRGVAQPSLGDDEQRDSSPSTTTSITTPEKSSYSDVPLTPEGSPTTVIEGPNGGRHNIFVSRSPSSASKPAAAGNDQVKTDLYASDTSQVTRLNIDELGDHDFSNLVRNLRKSKQISKLIVSREVGSKRTRSPQDIDLLFSMIKTLTRLQTIDFIQFESQDLAGIYTALYAHPTLTQCQLTMASGGIDEIALRTLTTIPFLVELTIETKESFAFHLLLRSQSLRKLSIRSATEEFKFADNHITPLVDLLETNAGLQTLHLQPAMSCNAFKLLTYALRLNTSVETFQVSLASAEEDEATNQVVGEIVNLLDQNRTLKTLWNLNHDSLKACQSDKDKLMKALESNSTITSFLFIDEDPSFQKQKEELFRRRNTGFMRYYLSSCGEAMPMCGEVIPGVNTHYLVDKARLRGCDLNKRFEEVAKQGSTLSKRFEEVAKQGTKIGNDWATSFGSFVRKTMGYSDGLKQENVAKSA